MRGKLSILLKTDNRDFIVLNNAGLTLSVQVINKGLRIIVMADLNIVRRHLLAIVEHVARLRRYIPFTDETVRANPGAIWVIERGLYL